jgi:hypothetical protein
MTWSGTQPTEVNQSSRVTLTLKDNMGPTDWGFQSSSSARGLSITKLSDTQAIVEADESAEGAVTVYARDRYKTLTTTVTVPDTTWDVEPTSPATLGISYPISVKNVHNFGKEVEWILVDEDAVEYSSKVSVLDEVNTLTPTAQGFTVLVPKYKTAVLSVGATAYGLVTVKAKDWYTIVEKEVKIPLSCLGNPSTIVQGTSINLSVLGGVGTIDWSLASVGTSSGFSLTGSSSRTRVLTASASALGSVVITVTDDDDSCDITVNCSEGADVLEKQGTPAGNRLNGDATGAIAAAIVCLRDWIETQRAWVESQGYTLAYSIFLDGTNQAKAVTAYTSYITPGCDEAWWCCVSSSANTGCSGDAWNVTARAKSPYVGGCSGPGKGVYYYFMNIGGNTGSPGTVTREAY